MLTKLSHAEYDYFDTLSSDNIECPIDIEYSLPDYCPDIQKILKCLAYPEVTSYSFTQDKLMCEGKLTLYIQYVDEKSGNVRVCEINKEYSVAREITQSEEKTIGRLSASTGHIVCRAISARKLDIHIPIVLTATISAHKRERVPSDTDCLEKKMEIIPVSHGVNGISHQFVMEEELDLPQGCPPIESILRKSVVLNNVKCTAGAQKIQLEGIADICVMYRSFSENLSVEKMSYSIPFQQSIDTDGAEVGCITTCNICVGEFSLQPKEDSMGEYTVTQMFLKLFANICLYKHREIPVIVDAYSTKCRCESKYQSMTFSRLEEQYDERLAFKKNMFLSEDEIEKLLDLWCEEISVTPYTEKNKITYRGKFGITLLYQGKSKQLFTVSKPYDFSVTREFGDLGQRKAEASVKLFVKDFRIIDGNNIEVGLEGMLGTTTFVTENRKVLISADVFDEELLDNSGKITVYYSGKEEELWEIGKRYNASVASIIENNSLIDHVRAPGGALAIF